MGNRFALQIVLNLSVNYGLMSKVWVHTDAASIRRNAAAAAAKCAIALSNDNGDDETHFFLMCTT